MQLIQRIHVRGASCPESAWIRVWDADRQEWCWDWACCYEYHK